MHSTPPGQSSNIPEIYVDSGMSRRAVAGLRLLLAVQALRNLLDRTAINTSKGKRRKRGSGKKTRDPRLTFLSLFCIIPVILILDLTITARRGAKSSSAARDSVYSLPISETQTSASAARAV